jgi:chromosome partitioning protein
MPLTVAVALLKGGVSKTTTAIALAEAAALSVPAVVVDTDPMGSAARWHELAGQSGRPLNAQYRRHAAADLPGYVLTLTRAFGVIVIDTPPPGARDITDSAVDAADTIVMPVPPNAADLDRVDATREIAVKYGKPAAAVLTQVRGGLEDSAQAAIALRSWDVPVYATELPLTVAVQRAYGQPLSGPLLRFGIDLLTEIAKETGL